MEAIETSAKRSEIVAYAQTWISAPFQHQGRTRDGVDCVGLVIDVAHQFGLSGFEITDYTRQPNPDEMQRLLEANLDYVAFRDVLPADILWLRAPHPQHLALVTQYEPMTMIHSFNRPGIERVVENVVDRYWRRQIVACFRFRGLA